MFNQQGPQSGKFRRGDYARVLKFLLLSLVCDQLGPWLSQILGTPSFSVYTGYLSYGFLAMAVVHVTRRLLMPRIDFQELILDAKAKGQSGQAAIAVAIIIFGLLFLASGSTRAAELPPNAKTYLPMLVHEKTMHWPEMSQPAILAGQVHKETCITVKHRYCWNPMAELKTSREWGVGLGQITQVPGNNMDALRDIRAAFPKELGGWGWDSKVLYRADYQLRALVLMNKKNYARITGAANEQERLAMMLVSYNGGPGRVISDRRMCAGTKGCDSSRWFGHAEKTSRLPQQALPGYGKSFFQITRDYPRDVMFVHAPKYEGAI